MELGPKEIVLAELRKSLDECAVESEERVLVGCSGGADSMTLAHAAMTLMQQGRLSEVVLVYVDHGLRDGAETAADFAGIEALARSFQCECRRYEVVVEREGGSLEASARRARYAAFEAAAADAGAQHMLLAHTASDQAETILMRVLRGTGVMGLAGIPRTRGIYVRPILQLSRDEILAYVAAVNIQVTEDATNSDIHFTRNWLRHAILPQLKERFPKVEAALNRLAGHGQEHRRWMAEQVRNDFPSLEDNAFDNSMLASKAKVMLKVFLGAWASARAIELEAVHLQALVELIHSDVAGSKGIDLPGLYALREYEQLLLFSGGAEGGKNGGDLPKIESVTGPNGPYEIRLWEPGDRMRPLRLKGCSKKISDLYTDTKVPRRFRSHAQVVLRASDRAIVWASWIGASYDSEIIVNLTHRSTVASNNT